MKQVIIPVLRILDVSKANEFYIDWLGFKKDWEHSFGDNFPVYMQLSMNDVIIQLTEHYGDCLPGARIRIFITSLEKYHKDLTEKDYKYFKPGLQQTDWGTTEMSLIDPFGNHLIFIDHKL